MAHPPRSNPPLRSSSDPPSPCITPSTETFVVIVSFMIVVPFSFGFVLLGRPSWAAAHPATSTSAPIRHRLRGCLSRLSGTPVVNDPTRRSHSWTPAPAVGAAGGFRSVAPHLDLPIAGFRPLGGELERHVEVGGLDDPEAGEVLLVSNVGGSWPCGWHRSVV